MGKFDASSPSSKKLMSYSVCSDLMQGGAFVHIITCILGMTYKSCRHSGTLHPVTAETMGKLFNMVIDHGKYMEGYTWGPCSSIAIKRIKI